MQYNPGWNNNSVNLLHVQAVGPRDSLHYVWSSIGAPAVLLVATQSPSSDLRVNWSQLLSPSPAGAIWIEPPDSVVYSTAVVFTKVLLLWDSWGCRPLNVLLSLDPCPSQITAFETSGRAGPLPSLLHTADSSQLEFILAGVTPRGNSSRFVLEMATVEEAGAVRRLHSQRSIDDEYTPTIFEVLSLLAEPQNSSSTLGFLQWKATAYGSRSPRREDGIQCRAQELHEANWTLPMSTLVQAYFGHSLGSSCTISALNVTFGGEEGEVYREKRYLSW
ncbi:GLMPA protein, partial [Erithacus rubecula]|nr:GLMPA protein [Erithacus rubecula]